MKTIKILQKWHLMALTVGILAILAVVSNIIFTGSVANAAPCTFSTQDNQPGSQCINNNFQTASGTYKGTPPLDAGTYNKAVTDCKNKTFIFSGGGGGGYDSTYAGCSNAIVSCLSHETNQAACLDSSVLAAGASCETQGGKVGGDIGAGGDCGWESIISDFGGSNKNNQDTRNQLIQDLQNNGCKAESGSTTDASALQKCQDKINQDAL